MLRFGLSLTLCGAALAAEVRLTQSPGVVELDNGRVRAVFTVRGAGVTQEYFARGAGGWEPVVRSFAPPSPRPEGTAPLYGDRNTAGAYRLLVENGLRTVAAGKRGEVILSGTAGGHRFRQVVSLAAGAGHFDCEVSAELAEPKLEYLLSTYVFVPGPEVDFSHAPAIKRQPAHVIGDRVFFSPALILQKGKLLAALAPNVELLNEHVVLAPAARQIEFKPLFHIRQDPSTVSLPAALDLEFRSGMTPLPLLAYGMLDSIAEPHVYWLHKNEAGTMVRELSGNKLRYGFQLFLDARATPRRGHERISRFFWQRYGSANHARSRPQAMPYSEYARLCYPAAFVYKGMQGKHETWQELELNGRWVGATTGNFRTEWFDDLAFTAWWNNARDAIGMAWWGRRLKDPALEDKARKILELALAAPQNGGIFPSFYDLGKRRWIGNYWEPPSPYDPNAMARMMRDSDFYHTSAASKTGAWLLRYREQVADDPRIVPYVRRYGDFLLGQIDGEGRVPAWFSPDLKPAEPLRGHAEGGVHIWFLTALAQATNDPRYSDGARRIAAFLRREVLPQQRWLDFEAFQSCSRKPETFFDAHTHQGPRNTLAMYWAIEGLQRLYRATADAALLDAAQQVADYATLYQAVWHPHYVITAYTFGGFSVQNSDAEWLDARQSEFALALTDLALACGRQDLLERAVAAMRASLALVNHPRHVQNQIYNYPNYPLGLGPENVDHGGFPQSPGRTAPGWAEVSALSTVAEMIGRLGGAYINFRNGLHAGLDGVHVGSYSRDGRTLHVRLSNQLAALPHPYLDPFEIELVLDGLPRGEYRLVLNGGRARAIKIDGQARVPVRVDPGWR